MRKIFFCLLLAVPFFLNAQVVKTLKKTVELVMPKTAEDTPYCGTRGGAVVWNPVQKKYYAAFVGNANYPLAVFDMSGKRLSDDDLVTMQDLRGMWYSPTLKKICGNGYNETGWFSYTLDEKGIPADNEVYAPGMNQPTQQSIGIINPSSNRVYFLNDEKVYVYNAEAMPEEDSTIQLHPGISNAENIDANNGGLSVTDNYSSNVLLYTGIPKAEFGLLNVVERQVELYDRKTGLLTQKLKLPDELQTWPSFNFSYANGTYWAFDQDTRIWTGYK